MSRNSQISKKIYQNHIRLYRTLNDAWILTQLTRQLYKSRSTKLRASKDPRKKGYRTPKKAGWTISRRRDADIGQMFFAEHERGMFESNIVSLVSRTEAFIQESVSITIREFPEKLKILSGKAGVPLELLLEQGTRDDLLERFVTMKCEELMFSKPSEYLAKVQSILSIELNTETLADFIEIKATRDVIVHGQGAVSKIYLDKSETKARGKLGEELKVDIDYFKVVIITLKKLSGDIQSKTEQKHK